MTRVSPVLWRSDVGRRNHGERAGGRRGAETGADLARGARRQQVPVHVAGAPAHRVASHHVLGHRLLEEANRRVDLHLPRLHVGFVHHPAHAAVVVHVAVRIDHGHHGLLGAVLVVEVERRPRGLAGTAGPGSVLGAAGDAVRRRSPRGGLPGRGQLPEGPPLRGDGSTRAPRRRGGDLVRDRAVRVGASRRGGRDPGRRDRRHPHAERPALPGGGSPRTRPVREGVTARSSTATRSIREIWRQGGAGCGPRSSASRRTSTRWPSSRI